MVNFDDATIDEKTEKALVYAITQVSRWVEKSGNGPGIFIPALDEALKHALSLFTPVWESTNLSYDSSLFSGPKRSLAEPITFRGYRVAEQDSEKVCSLFIANTRTAKVIADRLSANISLGMPMPRYLRVLASALLSGELDMPRRQRGQPSKEHRDALLVGLARQIQLAAGIPKGAKESAFIGGEPAPVRGCTIIAAAMHGFGVQIDARQALRVVYSKPRLVDRLEKMPDTLPPMWYSSGFSLFAIGKLDANDPEFSSKFAAEYEKASNWLKRPLSQPEP